MPASDALEFIVSNDEDGNCSIELDVDINYRPCKNHFRLYSRFDIYVSHCEYQYKIEGTTVLVRLFEDKNEDPGESAYWDVLDGVVQERAIRQREKQKSRVGGRSTAEKIEELKKQTEWTPLPVTAWNGFPYFVLTHNLPRAEVRRYFRQELERLMNGEEIFLEAAAKLGYEAKEAGKYHSKGTRTLHLMDGRQEPSEEESKTADLPGVLARVGMTWDEFYSGSNLISQLRGLLGETTSNGTDGQFGNSTAATPVASKPQKDAATSEIKHPIAKRFMVVFAALFVVGIIVNFFVEKGSDIGNWLWGSGLVGFLASALIARERKPSTRTSEEPQTSGGKAQVFKIIWRVLAALAYMAVVYAVLNSANTRFETLVLASLVIIYTSVLHNFSLLGAVADINNYAGFVRFRILAATQNVTRNEDGVIVEQEKQIHDALDRNAPLIVINRVSHGIVWTYALYKLIATMR